MTPRRAAKLAKTMACGLLMAACGTATTATTSHATQHPGRQAGRSVLPTNTPQIVSACDLVTPVDITAALGTPPMVSPTVKSVARCVYSNAKGGALVSLTVGAGVTSAAFAKAAEAAGDTRPVSGLGDAARQSPGGGSIVALRTGVSVRVEVTLSSVKPKALQSLARTALDRLQP
jgi:hypothetical protein